MSSISLSSLNQSTDNLKDTEVSSTGSLMDPGYVFVPANILRESSSLMMELENSNQPSYITSVYQSGSNSNLYTKTSYLPPDFNNLPSTGLSSIINHGSYVSYDSGAFLRMGALKPNQEESNIINNNGISNYLPSINNYPFNPQDLSSEISANPSTIKLKISRNEASISLNQWFNFKINETHPLTIAFENTDKIYSVYLYQTYGYTYTQIQARDVGALRSFYLSGNTGSFGTFSTLKSNSELLYVSLSASMQSEVFIRINELKNSPSSDLTLNSPVEFSNPIKIADSVSDVDPKYLLSKQSFEVYKFTVPESIDGKLLKFIFEYNSLNYYDNPNLMIISNKGEYYSKNSPFIGNSGDEWTLVFNTNSLIPYSYYLNVVESGIVEYSVGEKIDLILQSNGVYNFLINFDEEGIYEISIDGSTYYDPPNFQIINETGSTVSNNQFIFKTNKGNHILTIQNYYTPDRIFQVKIDKLVPKSNPATEIVSPRQGLLIEVLNNNPSASSFELEINLPEIPEQSSDYRIYVYSENLYLLRANNYYLNNQENSLTIITYTNLGSKFYVYIKPLYLHKPDIIDTEIFANVIVSGDSSGAENSLTITPESSGEYTSPAEDSSNIALNLIFEGLSQNKWYQVHIDLTNMGFNNNNYYNYLSEFYMYSDNSNMGFGFGVINGNTKSYSLSFYKISFSTASSLVVTLTPMTTKTLELPLQEMGDVIQASDPDFQIEGLPSTTNGFELLSFALFLGVIIIYRKRKSILK